MNFVTNLIDGGFVNDVLGSVGISQSTEGLWIVHVSWWYSYKEMKKETFTHSCILQQWHNENHKSRENSQMKKADYWSTT